MPAGASADAFVDSQVSPLVPDGVGLCTWKQVEVYGGVQGPCPLQVGVQM